MACFPEQIGKQDTLAIRCKACGHSVRWSNKKAVRLLAYETGPVLAARMLKCSKCDAVGQVEFV